jgi:rare lipoprotein A
MKWPLLLGMAAVLTLAPRAHAQSFSCEGEAPIEQTPDPFKLRVLKYTALAMQHRVAGLASYYSASLAGTLTANGERYRPKEMTAAHLTLPLGTWVELKARATGKTIRVRVNDRGPYVKKFAIDLSRAAARALGVDVAEDRWVEMRIIALPGEEPLPETVLTAAAP